MKCFEYKSSFVEYNSTKDLDAKLTKLGSLGWEVVKVEINVFLDVKQLDPTCFLILKREYHVQHQGLSKLFQGIRRFIKKL